MTDGNQNECSKAKRKFGGIAPEDVFATAKKIRFVLDRIESYRHEVNPNPRVLDFGCGAGLVAYRLAEQGYTMSGCDISVEMVNAVHSFESNLAVEFLACAGDALPYHDRRFAALVSSSMLEYVDYLDAALDELQRVLIPGGWLLVTVPDSRDPPRRKKALRRTVLRLPLLRRWSTRSRLADGAAHLHFSRNRMCPTNWVRRLQAQGFEAEAPANREVPLLLLAARRCEQSS